MPSRGPLLCPEGVGRTAPDEGPRPSDSPGSVPPILRLGPVFKGPTIPLEPPPYSLQYLSLNTAPLDKIEHTFYYFLTINRAPGPH